MRSGDRVAAIEREAAFSPDSPLPLERIAELCELTGARVDDELWWEVLSRTGRLDASDHPLLATLLMRLAASLRQAGYPIVAGRIEQRVAEGTQAT